MITLTEFREMMFSIEAGLDDSLVIGGVHFDPDKWRKGDFINWRDIEDIPADGHFSIKITGYISALGDETFYLSAKVRDLGDDFNNAEWLVTYFNRMLATPGYFSKGKVIGEDFG